jgi:hypothetical protein
MNEWDSTPRLAFMSPEKGSGKTRALEVSQHLVPRGVRISQATTGYIIAKVSEEPPPTLFYDEIDTVYGPRARGNEELRAVLNAGHRRGSSAGRGTWENGTLASQDYAAYCAVALAGLGQLPATVADRAVVIPMKKRKPTEIVEPWRERVNSHEARRLGEHLGSWMETAAVSWPEHMPVQDREADVWEALVMVAEAAGQHWPGMARAAAIALTCSHPKASLGIELLRDMRTIFGDNDKMKSDQVVAALLALPESPWARFHHNSATPFDARDLSRLLKGYSIQSKDLWIDSRTAKGYAADDLHDAWERYLQPL